jgi:hypothetical protein
MVILLAAAVPCVSCDFVTGDPVHQSQVDSLGPEKPGIPRGPYHRAGQPCTVCHSTEGPASSVFVLAGTVFSSKTTSASQPNLVGVQGVGVGIVDDDGAEFLATTNCVGNFYVSPGDFNPAFPVLVNVSKAGAGVATMITHIGRAGSCASCHADPPGSSQPGHVYLSTSAPTSNPGCPVSPVLTGN